MSCGRHFIKELLSHHYLDSCSMVFLSGLSFCFSCYISVMWFVMFFLFFYLFCMCTDVAENWLLSFPITVRKHLYDVFFVCGLPSEVIQALVPCLQTSSNNTADDNKVCSNAERLETWHPV